MVSLEMSVPPSGSIASSTHKSLCRISGTRSRNPSSSITRKALLGFHLGGSANQSVSKSFHSIVLEPIGLDMGDRKSCRNDHCKFDVVNHPVKVKYENIILIL